MLEEYADAPVRAVAVVLERGELPRRPSHLGGHRVVEHGQGGVPGKLELNIAFDDEDLRFRVEWVRFKLRFPLSCRLTRLQ